MWDFVGDPGADLWADASGSFSGKPKEGEKEEGSTGCGFERTFVCAGGDLCAGEVVHDGGGGKEFVLSAQGEFCVDVGVYAACVGWWVTLCTHISRFSGSGLRLC